MKPKYKLCQRFKIDKAIYVITEIRYDPDKETYLYMVNSTLFGFYEYQLKDEYFKFEELKIKRKKRIK